MGEASQHLIGVSQLMNTVRPFVWDENNLGVHQLVGRTTDQPDHTPQQQTGRSEEHDRTSHEKGGQMARSGWSTRRSAVCVPFTR